MASSNTKDGALLDISANSFRGSRCEKTFVDVKVFNLHAPSNRSTNAKSIYRKHKLCKKRFYEICIYGIKHNSFTPLIFSATSGMANEATFFSNGMGMILPIFLPSEISNPGSRSSKGCFSHLVVPVDLIQVESKLLVV